MAADKEIDDVVGRWSFVVGRLSIFGFEAFAEPGDEPGVIMSRIAAYMRHKDVDLFDAETIELRKGIPYIAGIHITIYRARGFELPQAAQHVLRADITGMPNLIHILEMLKDAFVQETVGIR